MTMLAQQIMTPVASDPNNVAEVFANGPINIQGIGPVVTVTFTTIRPSNVSESMQANPPPNQQYSAVVVSRVTMPADVVAQLKDLLNRTLVNQPIVSAGSPLKQ